MNISSNRGHFFTVNNNFNSNLKADIKENENTDNMDIKENKVSVSMQRDNFSFALSSDLATKRFKDNDFSIFMPPNTIIKAYEKNI